MVNGGNLIIKSKDGKEIHGYVARNLKISMTHASNDVNIYNNKSGILNLNTESTFSIFNAMCKLDGDASSLSEEDIYRAKSGLDREKLGIKDIKYDAKAGIVRIIRNNNHEIVFDFESDEEMQANTKLEDEKEAHKNKLKNAQDKGYSNAYDIELKRSAKTGEYYYEIKVKDRFMVSNPNVNTICKEFGVDLKTFATYNKNLLKNYNPNDDQDGLDMQVISDKSGVIKLPASKVTFQDSVGGFGQRNFGQIGHSQSRSNVLDGGFEEYYEINYGSGIEL